MRRLMGDVNTAWSVALVQQSGGLRTMLAALFPPLSAALLRGFRTSTS